MFKDKEARKKAWEDLKVFYFDFKEMSGRTYLGTIAFLLLVAAIFLETPSAAITGVVLGILLWLSFDFIKRYRYHKNEH